MEAITVVNKSGKVVSTSKHLVDVFKEARSAYLEKKAELKAVREGRDPDLHRKATKKASENRRGSPASERHRSPKRYDSDSKHSSRRRSRSRDSADSRRRDSRHYDSRRSDYRRSDRRRSEERYSDSRRGDSKRYDSKRYDSRRYDSRHEESKYRDSHRHESSRKYRRSSLDRGYSDNVYESDPGLSSNRLRRSSTTPMEPSHLRRSQGPEEIDPASDRDVPTHQELTRRHSDSENMTIQAPPVPVVPSGYSSEEVDMDLAYGELPPPLPVRKGNTDEEEIRNKMTTLTRLLEEANCLHYSARAVATSLENNPEAMAAVGLTLAEISNLARKIGPGALTALRGAFPAVIALLASPEFLIAGGVALGVTVVAFGGYKIIKRIKAKKEAEDEASSDELEEIQSDVDRIKHWRRGIEPAEGTDNESVATSVDAEFMTPLAGRQLREEGVISTRKDDKASKEEKKKEKEKAEKEKKDAKKEKKEKEKREKEEKSELAKKEKEEKAESAKKDKEGKAKEPSALALLFKKEQVVP